MDLISVKILDNARLLNEAIECLRNSDHNASIWPEEDLDFVGSVFKRAVKIRRSSWRIILAEELNHNSVGNTRLVSLCRYQRASVEHEYVDLVNEAIRFCQSQLSKGDVLQIHRRILLLKLLGDFLRYLVEVYAREDRRPRPNAIVDAVAECKEAYEEAQKLCIEHEIDCIDPLVLALALNHGVFTYEVLNRPKQACIMTKQASDKAISKLGPLALSETRITVGETIDERIVTLVKLMRDNLVRWTS